MAIETIGVVGAGQMGSGIAQVAAQSGLRVLLHDISGPAIMRALAGIGRAVERLVAGNKLTPETAGRIMANLTAAARLEDLTVVDFVIEAVSELDARSPRHRGDGTRT